MENQIRKTALITGSSGGIGSAVAKDLALKGYHLILMDINEEANRALARELPSAEIITLDLTNREELRAICKIIPNFGLDVAFINAGMVHPGDVLEVPEDKVDLQLEINLRSAIMLNKACGGAMKEKGGNIINTVSAGGIMGMKSSAAYSAAKFGMRGFLMSFHSEMEPYDVRISGLYPAAVDTAMLRWEAMNGGSLLNFVNTPSPVHEIVRGFNRALRTGRLEVHVPRFGSFLPRLLGGMFPSVIHSLYPLFEKIGAKGRLRYLKKLEREGHVVPV